MIYNIVCGIFVVTDFNSLKRYGASYGKLPSSYAQQKCSGRDQLCNEVCCVYRIAEKFSEFGELSLIHQTKTIQISTYNYNLLAESIHSPNFFTKCSKRVNSPNFLPAKLSCYTVYKILNWIYCNSILMQYKYIPYKMKIWWKFNLANQYFLSDWQILY